MKQLATRVPLRLPNTQYNDPHNKANLLIQALCIAIRHKLEAGETHEAYFC